MRMTQAFLLRLFLDTEQPEELRGTLQAISDGEKWSFVSLDELFKLLKSCSGDARLEGGNDQTASLGKNMED